MSCEFVLITQSTSEDSVATAQTDVRTNYGSRLIFVQKLDNDITV